MLHTVLCYSTKDRANDRTNDTANDAQPPVQSPTAAERQWALGELERFKTAAEHKCLYDLPDLTCYGTPWLFTPALADAMDVVLCSPHLPRGETVIYDRRECALVWVRRDASSYEIRSNHAASVAFVQRKVDRVREDYLLVLCKDTPIRAGTYVGTEFKTCNVQPEFWRQPLDQLVQFYKCVLDTEDMQLMQNEAQTKQLHNVVSCIQKNIAMYHDVIGDFVHVDNVLALNKIRKLTELIHTVEKLLVREPLTVVATSHDKGKKTTQVIREKTRVGYEDTCDADDYHVRNGRVQDNVADYDSDISRFSDDEGAWVG